MYAFLRMLPEVAVAEWTEVQQNMAVALTAWHERIPDYSIAPGETLTYAGNPRAPHRLPLVWD